MFDAYRDVMNAYDVGEALGVSKNQVYKILKSGELHAYREGATSWKIPKLSLIDYVMKKGQVTEEIYQRYSGT